jgi:hypothetical protein
MFAAAREIRLSPEERAVLEAQLRAPTTEQRHVLWARILLLCPKEDRRARSTRAIARELDTMPRTVSHWRIRLPRRAWPVEIPVEVIVSVDLS